MGDLDTLRSASTARGEDTVGNICVVVALGAIAAEPAAAACTAVIWRDVGGLPLLISARVCVWGKGRDSVLAGQL